jgi:hypothetical protein
MSQDMLFGIADGAVQLVRLTLDMEVNFLEDFFAL